MFKRRRRHAFPQLNTTSTADISFMLLTFFLMTTSMDTDKGLQRQLPPMPQQEVEREVSVKERNVMSVDIDARDMVSCDGKAVSLKELSAKVENFVGNKRNSPTMPEKSVRDIPPLGRCQVADKHVVSVRVSPNASYDAYFHVQNAIVAAYNRLRDKFARERLGHGFAECTPEERAAILKCYPQRISEAEPESGREGGNG